MVCSTCRLDKPDSQFREGIDADVCFRCRVHSVTVESASSDAIEIRRRDKQFETKDEPAYWRLRRQGLQPQHVKGSYELETRMVHPFEATMAGNLFPSEIKALNRMGVKS